MKKDAYYFSHDSNAKDDPKCVLLIEQLGLEGYGIFWVLLETLRDQPEYKYPLALIPALARRYNTSAQKLEAVIRGYRLFELEGDEFFFSDSLMRRMKHLEQKREKQSYAGKISAQRRTRTDVEQTLNIRSASVEPVKESKEKESKVKEIGQSHLIPPEYSILVTHNAEETILSNQIRFEQICIKLHKPPDTAKQSLRKYHLHMVSEEKYPKGIEAVFGGFEKWLMNEKKFETPKPDNHEREQRLLQRQNAEKAKRDAIINSYTPPS